MANTNDEPLNRLAQSRYKRDLQGAHLRALQNQLVIPTNRRWDLEKQCRIAYGKGAAQSHAEMLNTLTVAPAP